MAAKREIRLTPRKAISRNEKIVRSYDPVESDEVRRSVERPGRSEPTIGIFRAAAGKTLRLIRASSVTDSGRKSVRGSSKGRCF